MSGYSPILELGDGRLTPREKVARCIVGPRNPVPDNSKFTLDQLRQAKWDAAPESEKSDALWAADAILTALASGSGDHAELAKLAEAAVACAKPDEEPWFEEWQFPHLERSEREFIAAANPATVLALLAENAALKYEVQNGNEHLEFWETRATEAERKLAEAVELMKLASVMFHPGSVVGRDVRTFLSKEAERG